MLCSDRFIHQLAVFVFIKHSETVMFQLLVYVNVHHSFNTLSYAAAAAVQQAVNFIFFH